jgi:hypothetical protein
MFGFLSPGAIIMFPLAIVLDIIGLIFFILSMIGVGIPCSWLLDLAGLLTVGLWIFFRSGALKGSKGVEKLAKKALKRLGAATLVEVIPFVGDISPSWTWLVWKELKESSKSNQPK